MGAGIIDIGSNTIKFKIFESEQLMFKKIFPVQIGKGIQDGLITEKCLNEIQSCFVEILKIQPGLPIHKVIGTSALRDAKNSAIVFDMVEERLEARLEIIEGEKEAEYIYRGVRKGIKTDQNYLICDIGGGSVELIYCNNEGIHKLESFELGVIKLYKLRSNQDPYSEQDIRFYMNYLDEELSQFLTRVQTRYLVGASGSFESLIALSENREYSGDFEEMKIEDLTNVIDFILKSSQKERSENQLIPVERKVLLPLGAILVKYLINKLEINKFTISPNSLIEGLI